MIIDPQLKGEFGRRDFPHDLDAIVLSALINFFQYPVCSSRSFAVRNVARKTPKQVKRIYNATAEAPQET